MTCRVEVGGRMIAYRRAGEGPPLVLLHGGWADSRAWLPQLEALSPAFDLIAWDAPGCGGSDHPTDPMRLADYADAVAGLLASLHVERAHVCGLSFGAGLAIAVYDRHPHLVRSLVLAGAYAGWKGSLPPAEATARLDRARAEAQRPPAEWMDGYLPTFFTVDAPAEAVDLVRTMMRDVRPAALLCMLAAFADADLRAVLPRITVPTLLLYGELDVRSPLPVAQALHARLPASELVLLPGVGHFVNLAAPELFDAAVRRFLGL